MGANAADDSPKKKERIPNWKVFWARLIRKKETPDPANPKMRSPFRL
jgi:hypothetical protein